MTEGLEQLSVVRVRAGVAEAALDVIACEVPVALVYNGISHAVMMASPTDLEDFALGFSLSEGIIGRVADLYAMEVEHYAQGIELQLEISSASLMALKERRRSLVGRTGCGLCGAESLQQALRPIKAVERQPMPSFAAIQSALAGLVVAQPLQQATGATHAAAWCTLSGDIVQVREDVGRHNALDKLLGALWRTGFEVGSGFVLVSSRASYEMVHKVCSAGIGSLVALSAPTTLAIEMARDAGLNLVGFARPDKYVVYEAVEVLR